MNKAIKFTGCLVAGIVLAGLLAQAAIAGEKAKADNRIKNGGFEVEAEKWQPGQAPKGWHNQWRAKGTKGKFALDDTVKYSGRYSLKATGTGPGGIGIYQYFKVKPGERYNVSCYVKTQLGHGGGCGFSVRWLDAKSKVVLREAYAKEKGKSWVRNGKVGITHNGNTYGLHDWTKVEHKALRAPETAVKAKVTIGTIYKSKFKEDDAFWVDNVVVEPAPADVVASSGPERIKADDLARKGVFSFEGVANSWTMFGDAVIEKGEAFDGKWRLTARCTGKGGIKPSGAILKNIAVKPDTGYVARCRIYRQRGKGGAVGAHYTFGVRRSNATFLASRDAYARCNKWWGESVLPFRTGNETRIDFYVARRYGKGTLLFDAIELVEDNSVRIGDITPQSNRPFPTATSAEQQRGYIISRQHWMQLVYPTTYPLRSEVADKLTCRLSPGEYEPATFSLTGLRGLKDVKVSIAGDLQGPGGSVLPSGNVTVGVVRTIKRWLTNSAPLKPGQRYERRPLFVFPNHTVNIPARETRQFWLTIFAQPNLSPGRYAGRVTVLAQGAPAFELPLRVEVLPIKLASPEVTYGMYYRQHCQYPEFKTEEFFRRSLADMKAHGMNSFSVYADLSEKKPDGTFALNTDGGTPWHYKDRSCGLNWQMGILGECGLLSQSHPLLLLADYQFKKNSGLVALFKAYYTEKKWPEFLIYLVDEPSTPKKIAAAKRLNDLVHKAGVRTTTAMGKPGELAAYYDVWIVGAYAGMDITELAEKMGKERWAYMCTWNGNQPLNDRFYAGYNTWTRRYRGNWLWCYTERTGGRVTADGKMELGVPGYEDPWRVAYVLPSKDANIPTLGWEARREGVDDYRYLQTLRETAGAALKTGDKRLQSRALAAQRFLKEVEQRTRVPAAKKQYASSPEYTYNFIMHPNLKPEDYDNIRKQAADHIMALQRDAR